MLSQTSTKNSPSDSSGQQMLATGSLVDPKEAEEVENQIRKKIKVEVKREPDSTTWWSTCTFHAVYKFVLP